MGENISASVEAESPKHDNIPLGYSSCSKEPPHVHVDAVEQRSPKEKIFDDCWCEIYLHARFSSYHLTNSVKALKGLNF